MIGGMRRAWWRHAYRRFYCSDLNRSNIYAMNAGTAEGFELLVRDLAEVLQPSPDDVVLDLGCGNCVLSSKLFGSCRRVVAVDFSKTVLSQASAPPTFSLVVADIRFPPFRGETFSKVFSYSTLPHLGTMREVCRMLGRWHGLLRDGCVLFLGDVPDRARLGGIIMRAARRTTTWRGVKYWVAILMNNYFRRHEMVRELGRMGFEVQLIEQSASRRFHLERFDVLAVKRTSTVESRPW